jgi:hypothetical protein
MCIWSLVISKIATLQEIETHWSLDDVMRAHATLEMKQAMISEAQKANESKRKPIRKR